MIPAAAVPPGPPGSVLRLIAKGLRDPLALLVDLQRTYGDVVTVRKGVTFLVASPDGIKHVLQDKHSNYEKGSRYRKALSRLMGDGLITAEGEAWKLQRRMAQPAFLRKQHEVFAQTISRCTATLVRDFVNAARASAPFNLHQAMARHSLMIMMHLLFSEDLGQHVEELLGAFFEVTRDQNVVRVFLPVQLPEWFPTPSNLRFNRAIRELERFIQEVVARRRSSGAVRDDLLSAYLEVRDPETGAALSDKLLRDEMITLLSAGHETVSDSITWVFYELMNHPEIYEQVCSEADSVGDEIPPLAASAMLPLTTTVIQETLRLYPPVWGFLRTAIGEDTIGGFRIPAGSRVLLSAYLTQRDPANWDDPERFEPERFAAERSAGRHRFAWFPFGAGPRQCIGAGLAIMEAQLTILKLCRAVRLELIPGQTIRPLPRVSLKPNGPVMVRAHLRERPRRNV